VDVTELKTAETALQDERNVLSAILDTVGALVVVFDPRGRIVRFNRACEQTSGRSSEEMGDRSVWDLFAIPEERANVQAMVADLRAGLPPRDYDAHWLTSSGESRLIAWSNTVLHDGDGSVAYIIATGIDVTERKRLEKSILEISEGERRRIGQDLHDGLGQHLTGVAFMSKVLEQKLQVHSPGEAADAAKIARLVSEAISETRELARGLVPVEVPANGLMAALQHLASEVEDVSSLVCRFECDEPVYIHDNTVATHLYRIAQESVNNAVKHGRATRVAIGLNTAADRVTLSVRDNGVGWSIPGSPPWGMGLHIMNYRAGMIGAAMNFGRSDEGETVVTCSLPVRMVAKESDGGTHGS
jgi:two-component system CheB/CheR fusion protein